MSCTVSHYWQEHLDNFAEKLQVIGEARHQGQSDVLQDPNGTVGIIDARLYFDDDAYVDVIEMVQIGSRVSRLQYRYELVVDGAEVERIEYDPDLPADLQFHINRPKADGSYTHEPADRITLKKYLESCFDTIQTIRVEYGDES